MECGVGKEKRQGLWTFGMFATRPKTPGTITDDYLYETGFNVALYESVRSAATTGNAACNAGTC